MSLFDGLTIKFKKLSNRTIDSIFIYQYQEGVVFPSSQPSERMDQYMENQIMTGTRVDCLYRVSTDKQVDHNDKNQADIPMQRKACHAFCEKMGWTIVHEEQEDGVSGHKVRAENRDKLQIIKERARQGKFDILLVFMFDRIGRIADETPFVVEWFVKNGVRVWSTQEGEQRFDNHTDKLTNYIRFWQADGESEKTSIRTKTALGQLVEDGGFKGVVAPYGYDLVKSGRVNKRKHEVYELALNETEAAVVRIVFDKYVHEGYGAQRIATYLNKLGYRARSGKMWHHATIRGIICNLTYREKMEERKRLLQSVRAEHVKATAELDMLKAEVIKALRGESAFSKDLLGSMVSEVEAKCTELQKQFEAAQAAYEEGKTVLRSLEAQYDDIISWADMYDSVSLEAKKMIVNCLIKRVEVCRDYKLHIDFNIDFEQFNGGLDIVTFAA